MSSPYEGLITIDAKLLHALWCYGNLHVVKNVIYPPGSHQECLAIVDRMFRDRAKGLNDPAPTPLSRNELAEAIHRGRFKDREPTPLGSDRLDREYAFRIADSVIAAMKSAPAVASSLPSGESEPLVTTAHAGAGTHQSSTAMTASAEPVAWRVRQRDTALWALKHKRPNAAYDDGWEVQPLYATPPSDAARERCSDCPPVGYPTDKTRCCACDRRKEVADAVSAGYRRAIEDLGQEGDYQNKDWSEPYQFLKGKAAALSAAPASAWPFKEEIEPGRFVDVDPAVIADAIRKDAIEECARNLEQSYPGHAWLNAACAATRSLARNERGSEAS